MINNKDNKSLGFGAWLSIVGLTVELFNWNQRSPSSARETPRIACIACRRAAQRSVWFRKREAGYGYDSLSWRFLR